MVRCCQILKKTSHMNQDRTTGTKGISRNWAFSLLSTPSSHHLDPQHQPPSAMNSPRPYPFPQPKCTQSSCERGVSDLLPFHTQSPKKSIDQAKKRSLCFIHREYQPNPISDISSPPKPHAIKTKFRRGKEEGLHASHVCIPNPIPSKNAVRRLSSRKSANPQV